MRRDESRVEAVDDATADALAMHLRHPGLCYGGPPTDLERRGLVVRNDSGHSTLTADGAALCARLFLDGGRDRRGIVFGRREVDVMRRFKGRSERGDR